MGEEGILNFQRKQTRGRLWLKDLKRHINSVCKLGHIFAKPKDPVSKEQRTDAIYSIPCNDGNNEYIGQTKRQFGTLLKEHHKAVFFCKKENSALAEHTCLTNHTIGWDKSKIITTNRRYHRRPCLEAWHINSAHAPLYRDDGGLLPDAHLLLVRKKAAN